jgi:hypothetical protein
MVTYNCITICCMSVYILPYNVKSNHIFEGRLCKDWPFAIFQYQTLMKQILYWLYVVSISSSSWLLHSEDRYASKRLYLPVRIHVVITQKTSIRNSFQWKSKNWKEVKCTSRRQILQIKLTHLKNFITSVKHYPLKINQHVEQSTLQILNQLRSLHHLWGGVG